MTSRSRVAALVALALSAVALVGLAGAPPAAAEANGYDTPAKPVSISNSDASREAQLVAGEDRRLQEIRTISTLARWQNRSATAPYRLGTPSGYTLVLTARRQPYVFSDLQKLEPQTLQLLSDGSYLLTEHIVVLDGAELNLSTPGLVLRLASGTSGFATIVSYGGRLTLLGTPGRPLQITSWDSALNRTDSVTADGRAYLRALGGQVDMSYVDVTDLGFWSGRTGGISLTGTDRPNTGTLDMKTAKSATADGSIGDLQILPTGNLPTTPASADGDQIFTNTFVAARIDHVITRGNAIGLFASGADSVAIADSQFLDSQIAGVDLHRFVTSSTIQRTVSNGSGGAGFNLGRATQGVQLTQCTARGNAGDGFTLSGEPLATGPSAVGSPINRYGNNLLSNSTAADNGHYGVYIKDGFNVTVAGTHVSGSAMGIVATEGAGTVSINANHVDDIDQYGIALLDGVTHSTIAGNVVDGSRIYLRDSQADVQGNTVVNAVGHAISVVGAASGTKVLNNIANGTGSSAIDTARSHGDLTVDGNVENWKDTTGLLVQYWHMVLHPMSLLWVAIFALVLVSAFMGLRRGPTVRGTNPYARRGAHLVYTPRI